MNDNNDWVTEAKVRTLEVGEVVEGLLAGRGRDIARDDGDPLETWQINTADGPVAILSCYQLQQSLPALVGKMVRVRFDGKTQTAAGRQVSEYTIASKDA